MNEQPQQKNISDELAKERSRQAAERTLMAWVRTSLAFIMSILLMLIGFFAFIAVIAK